MTDLYERSFTLEVHGERALLMLPLNVVVAARVRGELEAGELKSLVEKLRRRHALLGVRVLFDDDGSARYETAGVGEIPVRVVNAVDGEGWLSVVVQEFMTPFPLESGPLIRFALIRSADRIHLTVAGHHAICDGMSLTFLIRDVIEYLADADREVEALPPPPPIDATTVPSPTGAGIVERWLTRLMNRQWEKQGVSFGQEDMERLHETFWQRNGTPLALVWEWPPSEAAELAARCRKERVTVNSAVWTAFLAAQQLVQGDEESFRHRAGMAVSTRDRLTVPVGETLGFYASSLTAELKYDPRLTFWDGARQIHGAILDALQSTDLFRMLKAEALHPTLVDSLYFTKYGLIANRISSLLLDKMRWSETSYGFSITNVGRVDIPTKFGAREIEAIYGPLIYSDVNEKVVGVTTVGDRMTFSLTCNASAVGADVAGRIRDSAMERLKSAIA